MMDSIVSWFVASFSCGAVAGWLLYKLYEHDYPQDKDNENNFDYWS